jgi:Uma2 family endonuclease
MITVEKQQPRYEGLRVTNEEYMLLEDDGFKYDMIDGVLHMAPSPFEPHMDYAGELSWHIKNFVKKYRLGKVYQELDVHLPDGGDVLRPDITVVLKQNKHIIKKWVMGTPDLVCEVLSDSTRKDDLFRKADRYLLNAVKEYWILDPDEKWMELWKNKVTHWEKIKEPLLRSDVLEGFELNTVEFFSEEE